MNSATNTAPAALEAPETPVRDIDREALQRLDDEVAAKKRAEAERQTPTTSATNTAPALEEPEEDTHKRAAAFLERQLLEADPKMDAELRRTLASFGATMATKPNREVEAKATEPAPPPPKAEQKGQLILFPQWADDRRAAVHAIFRSALFPALNFKEGRPFLKEQRIVSVKGLEVFFTGEQFDQSDLDVYLELLNIAHESPFGVECCFTAYSLLKALGRATGKANHKWLHTVLIRLRSGTPDMTDHGIRYFGGLIEGGFKDETTKHYSISINPAFARLFKAGMWASIDSQQRRDLGRNQTAKALHAYYSTHAAPGPHSYEKLAALIGLQNKQSRDVRANLIKAHGELKRVGFLSDYEAGATTIKPMPNHTPSQSRHIVKQITKSRKKTSRNDE